jgi:hypothetical protein
MTELETLYQTAFNQGIGIIDAHFSRTKKACCISGVKINIILDIKAMSSCIETAEKLGRELKHIETGNLDFITSTANFKVAASNRRTFEARTKHAYIKDALPFAAIRGAVESGCDEVWEIAEFCGRTEGFVKEAIVHMQRSGSADGWFFLNERY